MGFAIALFLGVKVGAERWKDLQALYQPHTDDHVLTFHDAHMFMTYAHAPLAKTDQQEDIMFKLVASLKDYVKYDSSNLSCVTSSANYSACKTRPLPTLYPCL